jgi:hypothetical protein
MMKAYAECVFSMDECPHTSFWASLEGAQHAAEERYLPTWQRRNRTAHTRPTIRWKEIPSLKRWELQIPYAEQQDGWGATPHYVDEITIEGEMTLGEAVAAVPHAPGVRPPTKGGAGDGR